MKKEIPERGDIIWVDFSPTIGHEQKGHRPALVLSDSDKNRVTGIIQVCPITSKASGWGFELALLDDMKTNGVILIDQLTGLDWNARNIKVVEKVPDELVDECMEMIQTFMYQCSDISKMDYKNCRDNYELDTSDDEGNQKLIEN